MNPRKKHGSNPRTGPKAVVDAWSRVPPLSSPTYLPCLEAALVVRVQHARRALNHQTHTCLPDRAEEGPSSPGL